MKSMKTRRHDEPIIVGFIIFNNAKQRRLYFKPNFLGLILRCLTSQIIETDTDLMYLALTGSLINECLSAEAK